MTVKHIHKHMNRLDTAKWRSQRDYEQPNLTAQVVCPQITLCYYIRIRKFILGHVCHIW